MFKKNFRKIIFKFLTANKLKKFQRKSLNTNEYASVGVWGCLLCIGDQSTSFMTMKTTTISGKIQKFTREVREEKVEAI